MILKLTFGYSIINLEIEINLKNFEKGERRNEKYSKVKKR